MKTRLPLRFVLILALGLASACGPSPDSITVQPLPTKYLRTPGQNVKLDYVVLDKEGHQMVEPKLRWTSSASDVALVQDGVVTVRKSGKTTIGVTGGNIRTAIPLDLTILNSLDVKAPGADFMEVGRTIKLRVVARNEQGESLSDAAPEFRSSDEAVVRVEDGQLIAVRPGAATVTATLGHLTRAIAVQVVPPDFARLGLNLTHFEFQRVGQSVQLQARAYNRNGAVLESVPLEWFSSDANVVSVSQDGRVTAVGSGRAVVSVVAGRRRTAAELVVK
ncbi:Ig-like domain-containing protein [Pyxidicoccus parkwayensis]|uniref:Ig-like domain-containing protein n=1 Tax=Pyxidicoccus parkwayensis TaxID=2813578 RepID=A0ABX7NXV2_9BACT|nr:Ig-like domain-containing protein [Pyxidicoccus parkwaysis]QSQ22270.1 Ig-like domain-containing protein [Pyxidicoccus parkwaysis]